ncbi:bifunctional diaminohydroxyphosphoribosylaminopyrimidine deaminase/5-amino-6-(5-phosphoribosylamino)uracil reductase RibD [Calidifontibacillus oryziterrae]|uniref:bifunctional diaminohydroxyphosphoribosylaminopyrimidine deaminase/5-amino-6-(5-phosphoribosylamino)uracil reductase RibD n=1 Tax=Calidifontibacillus oryziterrae TaxID=1191699 RepID=UPI0002F32B9B|nr:bifunctional diaminohydroxyphosphoribosylaminopyrimidine deaminase/5-amino-6-(5-phosphoribosylamino)uracil reductase RibD [Calidifontibacillus oryziterrae]
MTDENYMQLAIQLAFNTIGQTSPNPVVGAVVVKDNQIVGLGTHLRAGEAHAEVHAINMAGEKAKNSCIYVTLEPCSHFGRTPPCADLLIKSGVKRVVIASTDPNPQVAGKGIERLKKAGIEVDVGVLKEEADKLNEVFFHYISTGFPYVTLKSATSLDGKIATVTGESKWITGESARLDVHKYRHQHDAILVGVNTVLKDDPELTTRLPLGGKNPIRIILDTNLRIPPSAKVIMDQCTHTWVVVGQNVPNDKVEMLKARNIDIIKAPTNNIEIPYILKMLAERGITSLFVEGGSKINWSFIKAGAVNQMITYIAPKIIGGTTAPTAIGGSGFEKMNEVLQFKIQSISQIGEDIKIVSIPYTKDG